MRSTIGQTLTCHGTGLHTGANVRVTLEPTTAGSGIRFCRADLPERPIIPATIDSVVSSERRTLLGHGAATVSTVEHLLAAVGAHQIDDLMVVVDGPELPQFDGSSREYVALLGRAGIVPQDGLADKFIVREQLTLECAGAAYDVRPSKSCEIEVSIEWQHPDIGVQTFECVVTPDQFDDEMASARTFGFLDEIELLHDRGLIRGASQHSAIALSADGITYGAPLRWPNEFARHKALDLVGDLALLGGVLAAKIVARRPSHAGNVALAEVIRDQAHQVLVSHDLVTGGSC